MILLSAHKDVVKYPFRFGFKDGEHFGLLDNQIGVLCVYLALYGNESLLSLLAQGKIGIFHSDHEEFGLDIDLPKMGENDIIIVVDVASGEQYKGVDFAIENVYMPQIFEGQDEFSNWTENLKWEGFNFTTKFYNGDDIDEDESWSWVNHKKNVLSFIIPIQGDNWHGEECSISVEQTQKAVRGLQRLINYLL